MNAIVDKIARSAVFLCACGALSAGTATVQFSVKDKATGKPLNGAHMIVLNGADTVSVSSSKAAGPATLQLDVELSSVDGDNAMPASFSTIETHPNPCERTVTLNVPPAVASGRGMLKIMNVLGQQVYSESVQAPAGAAFAVDVHMQNLAQGMYIVQMTDAEGKAVSGKFLKLGSSAVSASPSVWASGLRPVTWNGARSLSKPAATAYTFTAFSDKNTADADGAHAGGFASVTVPISKDTSIVLELEKVPFSECGHTMAPKTASEITVDGKADEPVWSHAAWGPLNQLWLYKMPSPADFTGRVKIAWSPERLYVLAEIRDDSLSDQHSDPLSSYYMDDCFEVFIDENASGGVHTYNYNAFAYHISIFGKAVDTGTDMKTKDFSDHLVMKMTKNRDVYTWEISLKVFNDTFNEKKTDNIPVTLSGGKILGLAAAYCDNDGNFDRESFMGSIYIAGKDKNTAWMNASVFGTLELLP
jgi:hypothetical protein